MKIQNIFFTALLLIISSNSFGQDYEGLLKKALQEHINSIFYKWDQEEWHWDKYVDKSATVMEIEESFFDSDWVLVKGAFTARNPFQQFQIKFESRIEFSNSGMTILNLCYIDKYSGESECCDPSDWGLQ